MALLFTLGGSAATTGSVTTLASATGIYGKSSISVATLANLTGAENSCIIAADDNSANSKFGVRAVWHSSTNLGITLRGSNAAGATAALSLAFSALPSSGDVIVVWFWTAGGNPGVGLLTPTGTLLASQVRGAGFGALVTGTTGYVRINEATVVYGGPDSAAGQFNGGAIYSGAPYDTTFASASWWAAPTTSDPGLIFLSEMNDASSGTTPTSAAAQAGGQALVLSASNYSWAPDPGGWFSSPANVIVTSPSVASATGIASAAAHPGDLTGFIAYASNVPEPTGNAPFTSVTQIPTVTGVSPTLWLNGIASATAVGTITLAISSGSAQVVPVTGLTSQTVVGVFTPFIVTTVPQPGALTLQYILDMATAFSTANTGLPVLANVAQIIERIRSDQRAIYTKLAAQNRKRFLAVQSVTSSTAASARTISLSGLVPAVERVLQLVLADGRTVSIVDLLDTDAELAPRAYVFGPQLVEVGSDWCPVSQAVQGTLYYVQQPTDLVPTGDLTQTISLPGDWADLLIIPLAQYLAAQDTAPTMQGGPPRQDEIGVLQSLYDARLQAFYSYASHYSGTISQRFDVPRPLAGPR